jgi:ABC-2 type transport system ATP-binding protein
VTALLRVEDVQLALAGRQVLKGASLEVQPGSIVCLAGGNGAGKTTLLRVAAGIFVAHAGRVRAGSLEPVRDRRSYARHVGFVSAGNDGVYGRLKVRQNLEMWAAIAYVPLARRAAAVAAAIEAFGLGELAERRSDRLSLGQRQRIRLALGTLHRPPLLLLDEPHTSLDDEGLETLTNALEAHRKGGGAVVWAAPSPDHAPLPRDAVVTIRDGRT